PPPSNVGIDPAKLVIPTSEHAEVLMESSVVGLNPPELSSTEPRGIPAGSTDARGDAFGIAGDAGVLTCARLGPLHNRAGVAVAINTLAVGRLCAFRRNMTFVIGVDVDMAFYS